jgi:hypothetical protein
MLSERTSLIRESNDCFVELLCHTTIKSMTYSSAHNLVNVPSVIRREALRIGLGQFHDAQIALRCTHNRPAMKLSPTAYIVQVRIPKSLTNPIVARILSGRSSVQSSAIASWALAVQKHQGMRLAERQTHGHCQSGKIEERCTHCSQQALETSLSRKGQPLGNQDHGP